MKASFLWGAFFMLYAAVLAGGVGSRMGADVPKQFLSVGGQPVILRTLRRFAECPFDRIFVTMAADWLGHAAELLRPLLESDGRIELIAGGSDRTGSILRAVSAIEQRTSGVCPDDDALLSGAPLSCADDILVTHDAVRPFVSARCISESISAAVCGCAGVAVPSVDTVLFTPDGRFVTDTPDRRNMFLAQTPQTFIIGRYIDILASLSAEERASLTDVCGAFVRCGQPVAIVPGERTNIKLTTPFDLDLAECIAAREP